MSCELVMFGKGCTFAPANETRGMELRGGVCEISTLNRLKT